MFGGSDVFWESILKSYLYSPLYISVFFSFVPKLLKSNARKIRYNAQRHHTASAIEELSDRYLRSWENVAEELSLLSQIHILRITRIPNSSTGTVLQYIQQYATDLTNISRTFESTRTVGTGKSSASRYLNAYSVQSTPLCGRRLPFFYTDVDVRKN